MSAFGGKAGGHWPHQSRVAGVTEYLAEVAPITPLDVGRPDHLAPFLGVVGDKLGEVGGRTGKHRCAQIGKSCLDLGIGEGGIDFAV